MPDIVYGRESGWIHPFQDIFGAPLTPAVSDEVPESLDDVWRWGDFNCDDLIDEQDLSLLLSNWS